MDFDFFKIGEDVESPIFLSKTGEESILAESVTITIAQKSATAIGENRVAVCAVSPNPATEFVKVTGADNLKKIELIDVNGTVVASSSGSDELDIPSYLSGKFLVRIYDENMNVIVQKIIVK